MLHVENKEEQLNKVKEVVLNLFSLGVTFIDTPKSPVDNL